MPPAHSLSSSPPFLELLLLELRQHTPCASQSIEAQVSTSHCSLQRLLESLPPSWGEYLMFLFLLASSCWAHKRYATDPAPASLRNKPRLCPHYCLSVWEMKSDWKIPAQECSAPFQPYEWEEMCFSKIKKIPRLSLQTQFITPWAFVHRWTRKMESEQKQTSGKGSCVKWDMGSPVPEAPDSLCAKEAFMLFRPILPRCLPKFTHSFSLTHAHTYSYTHSLAHLLIH